MGTVSSRGVSSSMPGSLSMDPSHSLAIDAERLCPQSSESDDGVARKDVIDQPISQAPKSNHSGSLEQIANKRVARPSPGSISFAGLRDPSFQANDTVTLPDSSAPHIHVATDHLNTEEPSNSPSSSASSSPLTPPLGPLAITPSSVPIDMDSIQFHSPSSQIVGTPFATNSTRFEYPFPATPHNSTASMSHFPSPASSSLSIAPPSPGHAPAVIPLSLAALSIPLSLDVQPPTSLLSLTHPRMQKTPPIPPSLLKKRREKKQLQARRSTVDVSSKGQDVVHHAFSDSNLRRGGHGIKA